MSFSYIYIYIHIYIHIYIIYLSKKETQRFLRYTVFHVFPQSSDVIIFYTVCFFKKDNLS